MVRFRSISDKFGETQDESASPGFEIGGSNEQMFCPKSLFAACKNDWQKKTCYLVKFFLWPLKVSISYFNLSNVKKLAFHMVNTFEISIGSK